MVLVSLSCNCRRAATVRTSLTSFDNPVILPCREGMYATWTTPKNGSMMMLTQAVKSDIADQDHLLMGIRRHGHDDGGKIGRLGGDDVLIHLGHSPGSVLESVAVGILADAF